MTTFGRLALLSLLALGQTVQAAPPAGLYPVALVAPAQEDGHHLVLGAWENGEWLSTKSIAGRFPRALPWRVQELGGGSTLTNSAALSYGEVPCTETGFVQFKNLAVENVYRLATSPALNTRPRPVDLIPNSHATYRNIIRAELQKRGINNPVVRVTAIAHADLDGDGTQEVILEASHFKQESVYGFPPAHAGAGEYSLLLLRWVKNGRTQTTVLGESVFTRDEKPGGEDWQMPTLHTLAGIADLNGDGRMEVVVSSSYYEGAGAAALEWSRQTGAKVRLEEGCGV